MNTNLNTTKVDEAIKIIEFCIKNNKSINKTEPYEGFIRKVLKSNASKEDKNYNHLLDLFATYKSNTNVVNKIDIDSEEKYDNRSSWTANRDDNGRIIEYSFKILIHNEKPFIGKLTREQLETIHQYYPYVTMLNVSSYFPYLTFQQFKRILRCFNITKDSLFPLHILEEHTEEEIAEFALKNKASASLNKIVEKRSSFIEKKYFESQEKIHELKNFHEFIEESINRYYNSGVKNTFPEVEFTDKSYTDNKFDICYLFFSDIHYGKKYDSPVFGRGFNKDVAHDRMMQIVKKTIEYIRNKNLNKLFVLFGGDLFESIMPNGMRGEHLKSMDLIGIDQLLFGVDSQIEFIKQLRLYLGYDFPIVITYLVGNHDRIGIERWDDQDRTGGLIAYNMIEREFRNDGYIKINIPKKPVYIEKIDNYKNNTIQTLCIIAHHGDSEIIKKKGHELVNLYGVGTSGYHLVINGHWHSSEINFKSGTNYMEISLPSVCSVDEFILDRLGNNQLPGFLLGIYENGGFSFSNEVLY